MELERPLDDDFGDRLAKCYDRILVEAEKGHSTSSRRDAEETVDNDLKPCLECLKLIDRVRSRQKLSTLLMSRVSQSKVSPSHFPRQLGRFVIERELGRGGAGIVLLATDTDLGRKVALKVPHPQFLVSDDLRRRFVQEAAATARFDHPHIVRVFEAGQEGPISFLVTEYCDGPTLHSWQASQGQPIPPRVAASIVRDLAYAVQHAHSQSVVHRDIKPSNVLVVGTKNESSQAIPIVKLCDFGLAKVLDEEAEHTRTGDLLGTPAYMAPEQAEGKLREIDVRTDAYALGSLLFELLCGRPPFEGESRSAILLKVISQEPENVRRLRKNIPLDLAVITAKCLSKTKADRYDSAKELADDLARYLSGHPITARAVPWWERFRKWVRRRPLVAASAGIALVSVFAIQITLFRTNLKIRESLEVVRAAEQKATDEAHRSRILLYASDLRNADEALREDNVISARESLKRYVPTEGKPDLRTWPWFYLWNRALRPEPLVPKGIQLLDIEHSPDGKILVGGFKNGEVVAWELPSGREMWRRSGHIGNVNAVRFSHAGGKLWSTGDDGAIREWEGDKSRLLKQLTPGTQEMAISSDGKMIATGNQWGQVSIVDAATGELRKLLRAHEKVVGLVNFSPDGRWLVSGSEDGYVRLWSTVDYQKVAELQIGSKILGGGFSPDSQRIALAMRGSRELVVVSLAENACFDEVDDSPPIVQAISSPEPSTVARVGGISIDGSTVFGDLVKDGKSQAFRWSKTKGIEPLGSLKPSNGWSSAHAITPDGRVVVGQSESKEGPQAFRWTESAGMVGLGDLPGGDFSSNAHGVSSDGESVYGISTGHKGNEIFRWTKHDRCKVVAHWNNKNPMPFIVSSAGRSALCVIHEDHHSHFGVSYNFEQMTFLNPPSIWSSVEVTAIADDGESFAGRCFSQGKHRPFRWDKKKGFHLAETSDPFRLSFVAQSVSADGKITVGRVREGDKDQACFWNSVEANADAHLPRSFRTVEAWANEKGFGKRVQGWEFHEATGVSADGLTLTGNGSDPSGRPAAWVLRVPKSQSSPIRQNVELVVDSRCQVDQAVLSARWVDDEHVVTGTVQGHVIVVATTEPTIVCQRRGSETRIEALAVQPMTGQIATGAGDGEILVWPTLSELSEQISFPKDFHIDQFESCESQVCEVVGQRKNEARVAIISEKQIAGYRTLEGPSFGSSSVSAFSISPDHRWSAVTNWNGGTQIFNRLSGKPVAQVKSRTETRLIAWTPDSEYLITPTSVINIWKAVDGKLVGQFGTANNSYRRCLTITRDGSLLACCCGKAIEIWDLPHRKLLATLSGHTADVSALAFSPDQRTLASGSGDHSLRLWDLERLQIEAVLDGHKEMVEDIIWFPDGQSLATTDTTSTVILWDRRTRQQAFSAHFSANKSHFPTMTLSPDGRTLFVLNSDDRRIHFFDTGSQIVEGKNRLTTSLND